MRIEEDKSCDRDGFVDAGERGTIVVPVMNGGPVEMREHDGLDHHADRRRVVQARRLGPHLADRARSAAEEAEIEIEVDRTFTGIGQLQLNVSVVERGVVRAAVARPVFALINVDDVPGVSNVDTVESPSSPWTAAGADADEIWSRVEVTPFNHAWFGLDFGAVSDTTLESPDLRVGTTRRS